MRGRLMVKPPASYTGVSGFKSRPRYPLLMRAPRIEWTDATWNPVRGCSRVSEGCRNCYAERYAARFSKPRGARVDGTPRSPFRGFARMTPQGPRWTGRVELIPSKLDEPLHWRKPRRVFANSMSDLFHEGLPDEVIDRVFAVMALARKHTFQILTKRPERMLAWSRANNRDANVVRWMNTMDPFHRYSVHSLGGSIGQTWPLPNIWLGVSVENRATLRRIYDLQATPAAKRFISVEPMLEEISFTDGPADAENSTMGEWSLLDGIDWVIVGGESGPGARPCDVAWIRSVVRQCREAGAACFVKQFGARPYDSLLAWLMLDRRREPPPAEAADLARMRLKDPKGGDPSEWPRNLQVREFPS